MASDTCGGCGTVWHEVTEVQLGNWIKRKSTWRFSRRTWKQSTRSTFLDLQHKDIRQVATVGLAASKCLACAKNPRSGHGADADSQNLVDPALPCRRSACPKVLCAFAVATCRTPKQSLVVDKTPGSNTRFYRNSRFLFSFWVKLGFVPLEYPCFEKRSLMSPWMPELPPRAANTPVPSVHCGTCADEPCGNAFRWTSAELQGFMLKLARKWDWYQL